MSVELFLNTDYFGELFPDSVMAARRFSALVQGLKKAIAYGAEDYLVSTENAAETPLAFDYTIRDWIGEKRNIDNAELVERELQRYFARRLDKTPFFEEHRYSGAEDFLSNEVTIEVNDTSETNSTATLAFLHSGILLSPALSVFTQPFIDCVVTNLDESGYPATIRCISDEVMAVEHARHIQRLGGFEVTYSADIWAHRIQLFPNIEFCARVENQLKALDQWHVVLERLFELESYSLNWRCGAFDFRQIPSKATGEGEQVRSNTKAKQERTFRCPDGQKRLFLWHLRATPGAIRIYFYPQEEEQRIIVGHIGAKPYYPA